MSKQPELYWKLDTKSERVGGRFQFITRAQASSRGLLQEVLEKGEENAYVRVSGQTFKKYNDWKRENRGK